MKMNLLLFFSTWPALESLKKMKMTLLLFSSWPALESLQVVLTWVQGRPDEERVALEDVFPPWSKNQIRQLDCLAFFNARSKKPV